MLRKKFDRESVIESDCGLFSYDNRKKQLGAGVC